MEKKIILIIDDDPDIIQTIKGNLNLDGFSVISADLGRTGIELARTCRPDLVLLDLNLPDIDGITICEILRKEFDFPIMMLTARDTLSDKVLGLKSGADDYIVKPFEYLELSARVSAIFKRMDRSLGRSKKALKHIEIDYKTRRAEIRGESVRLTKTEFSLLELFVSHPDQTLSREFIEKNIWWDSQLYAQSRAVDVHIQRLRRKIEETPETPALILTVPGVGYMLRSD